MRRRRGSCIWQLAVSNIGQSEQAGETAWQVFRRDAVIIAVCVAVTAAFGVVHDLIDARISPTFYRMYKGAQSDASAPLWAAWTGLKAGASGGLAAGIAFCFAGDLGPAPPLTTRQILRWVPYPLILATVGSIAGCLVGVKWGLSLVELIGYRWIGIFPSNIWEIKILPPEMQTGIETVALMHTCLYAAGLLGILWSVRGIMRQRMRMTGQVEDCNPS